MRNEFKWKGIMPLALSACLLTGLVACGGSDNNDSNDNPQQETTQDGVFRTILSPENTSVSSAVGTAEISIAGDELKATVRMGLAKTGTHAQHIHAGTRCPTADDDTNGDGVVDATEASAVYGGVLLALDSDLAGAGTFPSGITYNYDESASVTQVLTNLGLGALALEGKVVNVHGVPDSTNLPATVQGGKENFPISCGVLTKQPDTGTTTGTSTADAAAASAAATAASSAASAVSAAASDAATSAAAATSAVSSATSAAASTGGTPY